MTPYLSVVIPVFNEAGNLTPLIARTVEVLAPRGREFEIIVVNDGSTDGTAEEIAAIGRRWPQCRSLPLPRRGGQGPALLAGLRAARGEVLLTMDGDGQNDPCDFPALLELVESGELDVACGWRTSRRDSTLRRVLSRLANAVRRRWLRDGVHDAGCQLRVMRRAVREVLFPMEMLQTFVPAIASAARFRVGERPVAHHPRRLGRTKFPAGRLLWRPIVALVWLKWRLSRGGQAE
jgi:dolichol-phosphate mannosyltransferase